MEFSQVDEAIERLEKANANLEPELLPAALAGRLLGAYARAEKLADFGVTALARKLDDASMLARSTGSSVGRAKDTIATGKILSESAPLADALKQGDISLDQASEIAKAEESAPGSAEGPLKVAQTESFHVLRDKARKVKLEAEQHKCLAERQHAARKARSHSDELGMVHIHMELEPHVGSPIVARAEAEAQRLARKAKAAGTKEPFERRLADAYAALLSGSGKGRAKRPELVILVSHEVAKRGWKNVREGEVCKFPGVGPVSPQVAREIAQDAFLNGCSSTGWTCATSSATRAAPRSRCGVPWSLVSRPNSTESSAWIGGNSFRTEFDHVEPRVALGPTSTCNLKPRCYGCHQAKTERDRKAGKLKPPEP